jgi:hypothetical protein
MPTGAPVVATAATADAASTATPRVTVRPALTPRPTHPDYETAAVVHIVGAIDDLQEIIETGGDAESWLMDEVAWLSDPVNGFSAVGKPQLGDYLSALEVALTALSVSVDPGPALRSIVALRPGIAAMAPAAVGTPRPTARPAEPIVFKGKGRLNTKPFSVAAGDYTVTITGTGDGNVMAELTLRDKSDYVSLFNEISYGKYRYETIIYAVAGGSYYLDMDADGPWTITLTPFR